MEAGAFKLGLPRKALDQVADKDNRKNNGDGKADNDEYIAGQCCFH